MRVLHKRADGLIVISRYLQEYYKENKCVLVPPLVDIEDKKWTAEFKCSKDGIVKFVYAGWPSRTKERLDLIIEALTSISCDFAIEFDVYGIDEKKYRNMYGIANGKKISDFVRFYGRVSHQEVLSAVKSADYSLVIRESCRKNNAGFPSKLVECISCGTAVLTTDISNVRDYVDNGKNGYIISIHTLEDELKNAILNKSGVVVEKNAFDYRNFSKDVDSFLKGLNID
jgi:glycosyltransferase involved in cell wall biosynthesis